MGLTGPARQSDIPAWYLQLGANADPTLYKELAALIKPEGLEEWFFKSNAALGGSSPAELVQKGNLVPLRRAAAELAGEIGF